jgi:predicted  nucleic acid-binding Zn-ribbon protein
MPHQCTECGRTFPDGSKEMLSGCPDCGGNKFQFKPSDAVDVGAGSGGAGGSGAGGGDGDGGGVGGRSGADDDGGAMSRAKATVRNLMGRGSDDATGGTAGESSAGQASLSEYSNADASGSTANEAPGGEARAGDASATDAASTVDSGQEAGGGSAGSDAGDESRVTPSGSSEWPKSGTEAYDTPAEQARRRESPDDSAADATSLPSSTERESSASSAERESPPQKSAVEQSLAGDASANAGASSSSGGSPSADEDESITAEMGETEDDAQRSARSDVVSPDELPNRKSAAPGGVSEDGRSDAGADRVDRPPSSGAADVKDRPSAGDVANEPDDESPDLDELREELNSQFESIKVLDPGKYELNLMELYDREEYIISLQEDGRYVIEVPESWRGDASPD